MILDYDSNPNLTPDDKVKSLKESVQRALEEVSGSSEKLYKSLLNALGVEASSIKNNLASLSERLEEEASTLSDAVAGIVSRLEAVEEIAEGVAPIDSRLTDAESAITTIQDNYVLLEARVAALEGNANRASFSSLSRDNIIESEETE